MTETRKWTNVDAGKIMLRRVKDAMANLSWEANTFVEITGVVGGREDRTVLTSIGGSEKREDVIAAGREIAERFDYTITKKNYKEIVAAFDETVEKAKATRPEHDARRTPDEDRERHERMKKMADETAERQDRQEAMRAQVLAKAPPGAHAVIVAELKEDTSDIMTDYFANKTVRSVAIGFRMTKREDFKALRRAAGNFPDTAHLGLDADKDIEHRDNHSMGAGNYLSDHGWDGSGSGWVVKSRDLASTYWTVSEIAIPVRTATAPVTEGNGYEIRPSSLGREGVVEVHFAEKPDVEVRTALKAAGFRWAKRNQCWYGREDRLDAAGIKR